MSPSTSRPQDVFRRSVFGGFTCHDCDPPMQGLGGQAAFYAHWLSEHYRALARCSSCGAWTVHDPCRLHHGQAPPGGPDPVYLGENATDLS